MRSKEHVKLLCSGITSIVVAVFASVFAQVQTNTVTSPSAKSENPQNASSVNSNAKCVNALMAESESVMALREAAEGGNAEAQFELGKCYASGFGVATNSVEAVKWFRKAAEQGHADAQFNLGVAYDFGDGVAMNKQEAAKWYHKATEQGDAKAQFLLGLIYENGECGETNNLVAMELSQKAREQGYAPAKQLLQKINSDGKDRQGKIWQQDTKKEAGGTKNETTYSYLLVCFLGACTIFKFLWASANKRKGIRSLVLKVMAVLGFMLVLVLPYLKNRLDERIEKARRAEEVGREFQELHERLRSRAEKLNNERQTLQEIKEKQQGDSGSSSYR